MPTLILNRTDLTKRLLEVARAVPNLLVEAGRAPDPPGGAVAPPKPYAVLYAVQWDGYDGPADTPEADGPLAYQWTVVGETHEQAEWVMAQLRRAFLAVDDLGDPVNSVDVPGLRCYGRYSVSAGGSDPDASLVSLVERFVFVCQAVPA